mmetsp:Transcript_8247/g.15820  ORF Transcript_8247/g.15820 Transcript_8247/m.15820 type:complete len:273 (+) Transcript_8247:189-1007(+)
MQQAAAAFRASTATAATATTHAVITATASADATTAAATVTAGAASTARSANRQTSWQRTSSEASTTTTVLFCLHPYSPTLGSFFFSFSASFLTCPPCSWGQQPRRRFRLVHRGRALGDVPGRGVGRESAAAVGAPNKAIVVVILVVVGVVAGVVVVTARMAAMSTALAFSSAHSASSPNATATTATSTATAPTAAYSTRATTTTPRRGFGTLHNLLKLAVLLAPTALWKVRRRPRGSFRGECLWVQAPFLRVEHFSALPRIRFRGELHANAL